MEKTTMTAIRAVIMGFAALLLIVGVERAIMAIHPHGFHFFTVDSSGYLLLVVLLALSIMVAKFSDGRAWFDGLLAGIGMCVPCCLFLLHRMSPDPRMWARFMGRPMLWLYVGGASVLLITSLWAQSATLWFRRRRLFASLTAAGGVGLVVAVFAAGIALMRYVDTRAQAIQDSYAQIPIDMPLPILALTRIDGTPIATSELEGHITVIGFWGTWCGACVAEIPSLEAVHKEFSGNPKVRFLFVNPEINGDTPDKISRFLQHRPVSMPVALDPESSYLDLRDKLKITGLPLLLVVDQHNHIRFREYGFENAGKTTRKLRADINALLAVR